MTYRGIKLTKQNKPKAVKKSLGYIYRGVRVEAKHKTETPKMSQGIYRGTRWVA